MATYYEGKISYLKETDNGSLQNIKEVYLLDAISYTDAEAELLRRLQESIKEFKIEGIRKMKLAEVFIQDIGNVFFKMKVLYITFDEKSQKEKFSPHFYIINADDPAEAYNTLKKNLGTLNDYKITDINTTPILQVFQYEAAS